MASAEEKPMPLCFASATSLHTPQSFPAERWLVYKKGMPVDWIWQKLSVFFTFAKRQIQKENLIFAERFTHH